MQCGIADWNVEGEALTAKLWLMHIRRFW